MASEEVVDQAATTAVTATASTAAQVDERAELKLVDWEALEFSGSTMILRVLWEDASVISAIEGEPDKLFITLRLDEFKTKSGAFVPKNSLISLNCPA